MDALDSVLARYRAAVTRERAAGSRLIAIAVARQSIVGRLRRIPLPSLPSVATALVLRAQIIVAGETPERRARLADALERQGHPEAAYANRRRAIELGSTNPPVYRSVAAHLFARGEWEAERDVVFALIELQERLAEARGLDPRALRYASREFVEHIGCLTMLDVIAKQAALAGHGPETIVVAEPRWVSNAAYLDCFRPFFKVIQEPGEVQRVRESLGVLRMYPHSWRAPDGRLLPVADASAETESQWHSEGRAPLLHLSDEQVARGIAQLEELGVPPAEWFAVLHVREDHYDLTRNARLADFQGAIDTVLARGGWLIRIGTGQLTPLPPAERVIDYATSGARTEEMDIFLLSQARVMIGTQSGPTAVAGTFGVPALATNQLLPSRNWFPNHIYLPKLYRRTSDGTLLSVEEALSSPAAFTQSPALAASLGVVAVDNTRDEIEEALVELLDLVEQGPRYTDADDRLQDRFLASAPATRHALPQGRARVGREFLRRYEALLS